MNADTKGIQDNTWCCAESRLMENFLRGELDGPDEMMQQLKVASVKM